MIRIINVLKHKEKPDHSVIPAKAGIQGAPFLLSLIVFWIPAGVYPVLDTGHE